MSLSGGVLRWAVVDLMELVATKTSAPRAVFHFPFKFSRVHAYCCSHIDQSTQQPIDGRENLFSGKIRG